MGLPGREDVRCGMKIKASATFSRLKNYSVWLQRSNLGDFWVHESIHSKWIMFANEKKSQYTNNLQSSISTIEGIWTSSTASITEAQAGQEQEKQRDWVSWWVVFGGVIPVWHLRNQLVAHPLDTGAKQYYCWQMERNKGERSTKGNPLTQDERRSVHNKAGLFVFFCFF